MINEYKLNINWNNDFSSWVQLKRSLQRHKAVYKTRIVFLHLLPNEKLVYLAVHDYTLFRFPIIQALYTFTNEEEL